VRCGRRATLGLLDGHRLVLHPAANVTNTWSQVKVDLKHMFRPTMGVGLATSTEVEIVDFATTDVTPACRAWTARCHHDGVRQPPVHGSTAVVKLIYMF